LVARRHEQIGDPTLAGGILDRFVNIIEMRGNSMRKRPIQEAQGPAVRCLGAHPWDFTQAVVSDKPT
jgi:hypothetical protein